MHFFDSVFTLWNFTLSSWTELIDRFHNVFRNYHLTIESSGVPDFTTEDMHYTKVKKIRMQLTIWKEEYIDIQIL